MAGTSKASDLIGLGMEPGKAARISNRSVKTGITAAGTSISDATDLYHEFNVLGTVAASTGVQLPDWPIGASVEIVNTGASTVSVYPHSSSGTINAGSPGAAQTVATTKNVKFTRVSLTDWRYVAID